MNIVFGAPFWEWRIREGRLAGDLLRPLNILHYDLAYFAGWKFVVVALWIPIALGLSAVFHPDLHPSALQIVVFIVAIWSAYFVRSMFQATIGMLNFWTTRGAAVFDLYMATEMLLSGRLVPLKLMPGWVQTLADFLPFKWTFGFPIESLVSNLSTRSLLLGLGAQVMWTVIGYVLFTFAWRAAIKRYRVNFFVQLFQSLIQVGTGLVMLSLVYSHTTELNGWKESELLSLLGVQILLGGFIHTFIQPNMELLMQDVQQGTLDYALTKPEDAQILVSVRQVRIWQVVEMISGLVLLIVGLTGVESSIGVVDALVFAFALGIGGVLVYCFWLILTIGAFWVVRIEHVLELFEGIYQTGRWPVGVYPGWLRYSVTFLVPVAFAVTVPAEALTSRLHWPTLALSVSFAAVLFAFTRWFWRFGLRHYSGASA